MKIDHSKSWLRLALLAVAAIYLYSCSSNSNTLASSYSSSGPSATATATPCPNPASIVVNNGSAYQVEMIFDGKQVVYIASGGSFTFTGCSGVHAFSMAGICPVGAGCIVPCPSCMSMNYIAGNAVTAICGRSYNCYTSSLVAGTTYTINVSQAASAVGCAGEIDWTCP